VKNYTKKSPCNDCPYRKDAPLRLWAVEEFQDLLESDNKEEHGTNFAPVYGCHKKDGHICVGWLMNQDKRRLPSIPLRISLSSNNVKRNYLDNLSCKSQMFDSIEEMCKANYPEHFKDI